MQLVNTERAAEVPEDFAAMLGHIERRGVVVEHVVDEPGGEVEQEFAADRFQSVLDVHAILEDPFEHQVADLVVVLRLGERTLGSGSEGDAAVARGRIFAVGDLHNGAGLVANRANGSGQRPFATALFAALGAWGFLGRAVNGYNDRAGSLCAHGCVLGECGR